MTTCQQNNLSDSEKLSTLIEANKFIIEDLKKIQKESLFMSPKNLELQLKSIHENFEDLLGLYQNKE
jgi:hypothetical protein